MKLDGHIKLKGRLHILFYFILCYFILLYFMLFYFILLYFMLFYFIYVLFYFILGHIIGPLSTHITQHPSFMFLKEKGKGKEINLKILTLNQGFCKLWQLHQI